MKFDPIGVRAKIDAELAFNAKLVRWGWYVVGLVIGTIICGGIGEICR